MKETYLTVKTLVDQNFDKLVSIRRHLHSHPELSFEEKETSEYVKSILDDAGITYTSGWAGYGIVAEIRGKYEGKTMAVRADMDALPIEENSTKPYVSKNKGIMHACGHDVHTTSLLGLAIVLSEMRDSFSGKVRLIFQPGEEKLPGGASIMIEEGVLKDPIPDLIIGLHVHPPLEVGKVGFKSGLYMASADEIYLTVKGKGGHAGLPQDCVDPIVLTSEIILALQTIVSRKATPTIPSVLTFGKINSTGGATNVIPNEVKVQGTFRTMDETFRKKAHQHMIDIVEHICAAHGGSADLDIRVGYPCLINDDQTTQRMMNVARDFLGYDKVVDLPSRMTAEDFSYYSHHVPACFFRLGTGNEEKGITSPVHTNTFDIDEDALKVSVGTFAAMVLTELQSN